MFGQRETYLDAVRRRQDREALAQLRTGSHWGAEETGRWTRRPREQRKPCRLAAFAAACHQRWLTATVALPAVSP
ncbi:hypothetical protein CHLNCDRAFT_141074 [Chlorella variabilis]|uniref:Uncharacterized protein n=1 Tax=Chlorella variabilis TaxID=554065 RepID=E1ZS41_CHLVA|nr:hypothetical protein CHLNCDRAFT_141074 [Chlorella variabilis]EFN51351.1 hypothetical protein CHLNCDRAFT_141074 [Chlorella variabilis]|eukprot:XP_005843453.1 hypothetical protein CHLNCDRAFT_141074 [Chlorella variabilis]